MMAIKDLLEEMDVCLSGVQNSDDATRSDKDGCLAVGFLESKDDLASSPPSPDMQQRQHHIE
eukprot:11596550-Ditylum_brightwellii.AAC.1